MLLSELLMLELPRNFETKRNSQPENQNRKNPLPDELTHTKHRSKRSTENKCFIVDINLHYVDQSTLVTVKGTSECDHHVVSFCDKNDHQKPIGSCTYHGRFCRTFLQGQHCEAISVCDSDIEIVGRGCLSGVSFVDDIIVTAYAYRFPLLSLVAILGGYYVLLAILKLCAVCWIRSDVKDLATSALSIYATSKGIDPTYADDGTRDTSFFPFLLTVFVIFALCGVARTYHEQLTVYITRLKKKRNSCNDDDDDHDDHEAHAIPDDLPKEVRRSLYVSRPCGCPKGSHTKRPVTYEMLIKAGYSPPTARLYNGGTYTGCSNTPDDCISIDQIDLPVNDEKTCKSDNAKLQFNFKMNDLLAKKSTLFRTPLAILFLMLLSSSAEAGNCRDFTNQIDVSRECVPNSQQAGLYSGGSSKCYIIDHEPVCVCKPGTYGDLCQFYVQPPIMNDTSKYYTLTPYGVPKVELPYKKGCLAGKDIHAVSYSLATTRAYEHCIPRSNNLETFNPDYHAGCNDANIANALYTDPQCSSGAELYPIQPVTIEDYDHVYNSSDVTYSTTMHFGKIKKGSGTSGIDIFLNSTFSTMSLCTEKHPDMLIVAKRVVYPTDFVKILRKPDRINCGRDSDIYRYPYILNDKHYEVNVYCTYLQATPHFEYMTATNKDSVDIGVSQNAPCRLAYFRSDFTTLTDKGYSHSSGNFSEGRASIALHLGESLSTIGRMSNGGEAYFLFRSNYYHFAEKPVDYKFHFNSGGLYYGFLGLTIGETTCGHLRYLLEMLPPTPYIQFQRDTKFDEDPENDVCSATALYESTHTLTFFLGANDVHTYSYSNEKSWTSFSGVDCTDTNVPVHHDSIHFFGRCFNEDLLALTSCKGTQLFKDKDLYPNGAIQPIYRCEQIDNNCKIDKVGGDYYFNYQTHLQMNGVHRTEIPEVDTHECKPTTIVCGDRKITTYVCGDICKPDDPLRVFGLFPIPNAINEQWCRYIYGARIPNIIMLVAFHFIMSSFLFALLWCAFRLVGKGLLWEWLARWFYFFRFFNTGRFCNRCQNLYNTHNDYINHTSVCHVFGRSVLYRKNQKLSGKTNDIIFIDCKLYDKNVPSANDRPRFLVNWLVKAVHYRFIGKLIYWHLLHRRVVSKYTPLFPWTTVVYVWMMIWALTFGSVMSLNTTLSNHQLGTEVVPAHPYTPINPPLQYIEASGCVDQGTSSICTHEISYKVDLSAYSEIDYFSLQADNGEHVKFAVEMERNFLDYETVLEYCTMDYNFTYIGRRTCYSPDDGNNRCSWGAHFEKDACTPMEPRLPAEIRHCPYDEVCNLNWRSTLFNACGCIGWDVFTPWNGKGSEMLRRYWQPNIKHGYSCIYRVSAVKHDLELCLTLGSDRVCKSIKSARTEFKFPMTTIIMEQTSDIASAVSPYERLGLRWTYGSQHGPDAFIADNWLQYGSNVYGSPGDFQMQGIGSLDNGLCVDQAKVPEGTLECEVGSTTCWTYNSDQCLSQSRNPSDFGCRQPGKSGYIQAISDPASFFVNNDEIFYTKLTDSNYLNGTKPTAQFHSHFNGLGHYMTLQLTTQGIKFHASSSDVVLQLREPVRCDGELRSMVHINCTLTVYNPSRIPVYDNFYSNAEIIMHHRTYSLEPGVNKISLLVSGHDSITDFDVCPEMHDGNCASFHGLINKVFQHNVTTNHDAYKMWGKLEGAYHEFTTLSWKSILFWLAIALAAVALFIVFSECYLYCFAKSSSDRVLTSILKKKSVKYA